MSGTSFSVNANKSDYCYSPLVCATDQGHLVVWAYGVESKNGSTLWVRTFRGKETTMAAVEVSTLADNDHILFLRRFNKDLYLLAVETTNGTNMYFLDENAVVHDNQLYKNMDTLIHCHESGEHIVLFTYNNDKSVLNIGTVQFPQEDWSKDYTLHDTFADVYGIPQVFTKGDQYIAGWLTRTDKLYVVANGHMTTLKSYDVDYLMAAEVDKDTIVYSGYDSQNQTLRLDFFRFDGTHICSRYWKSTEYKGLYPNLVTLNRGFMLLADAPDHSVCGQRFTHLGSWLYPMHELTPNEQTWSPVLARGAEHTLLVYIRDYTDHSQVWGKWLDVGEIPELDNLSLTDLEGTNCC